MGEKELLGLVLSSSLEPGDDPDERWNIGR